MESKDNWWNNSCDCQSSQSLEDTTCLFMYLSSSAHNSPHSTVCPTLGSPLVLKNLSCPGILTQGGYPRQKTVKENFVGLLLHLNSAVWILCLFYSFFLSRKRLTAFREVTPVDLPNCNFVKGIGMYTDEEVSNLQCKDIISLSILPMLQFSFIQNYNTESGV